MFHREELYVQIQWKEDDIMDCELIPFSTANIEDMVDLLRFKPKSLKYESSKQ